MQIDACDRHPSSPRVNRLGWLVIPLRSRKQVPRARYVRSLMVERPERDFHSRMSVSRRAAQFQGDVRPVVSGSSFLKTPPGKNCRGPTAMHYFCFVLASVCLCEIKGQQTFSVNGQIVSILGFVSQKGKIKILCKHSSPHLKWVDRFITWASQNQPRPAGPRRRPWPALRPAPTLPAGVRVTCPRPPQPGGAVTEPECPRPPQCASFVGAVTNYHTLGDVEPHARPH